MGGRCVFWGRREGPDLYLARCMWRVGVCCLLLALVSVVMRVSWCGGIQSNFGVCVVVEFGWCYRGVFVSLSAGSVFGVVCKIYFGSQSQCRSSKLVGDRPSADDRR